MFLGNSGSPVIRQSDMASVGVHVLGGNPNSASVISGPFGNPFDAYVAALKAEPTGSYKKVEAMVDGKPADWLSWVTIPTKESVSSGEADESNEAGTGGPDEALGDTEATIPLEQPESENRLDEGFFDIFKKALTVAGPWGMVASMALGAVGKLVAKRKTEAALDEAYSFEGVAERALLGEAALATVIQLGHSKCKHLGIFDRMQPTVLKLQPICRRVAPTIMPFVMEPAWRATGGRLTLPDKRNGEANFEPTRVPTTDDTNTVGFGPRLNANAESFLEILTKNLTMQDAESFTDTESSIGEVIGRALRVTGPILGSVAESGLLPLAGDEAGTEAGIDPDPEADINNPESSEYTYDAMTQRAIAGEASLEALLQTPMESLQQEAWWDTMIGSLVKNGSAFGAGASVLSGAIGIATSAINLATANKNHPKKRETQGKADQEQDNKGETGGNGEADVDHTNGGGSAEADFLAGLGNGA